MRALWKERFSLSLFTGKVRGVPRLLEQLLKRTQLSCCIRVCSEDHIGPWASSGFILSSLPLLQPRGNGRGAAPLALGCEESTTLDLFWYDGLVGSGITRNLLLFCWEQLFIRWNEIHIRHCPTAAGGVQEPLITVTLGVYFLFSWPVLSHHSSSWILVQGFGTPGYSGFCCVKWVYINSGIDSKVALWGRRLYGGFTAWVFLVWKHCLEGSGVCMCR